MLSKKDFRSLRDGGKNQIGNFARYQNFQFDFAAALVTKPFKSFMNPDRSYN